MSLLPVGVYQAPARTRSVLTYTHACIHTHTHTHAIGLFSLLSLYCSLQRTVIFSVVFAIKSDLSVDSLWSWQMLVVNDVAAEHLICDMLAVYIWGFPQYIFRPAAFKYLMSLWYSIVLTMEVVRFTSLFWHLVWTYTPFLASCLDIHTVSETCLSRYFLFLNVSWLFCFACPTSVFCWRWYYFVAMVIRFCDK